MNTLVLALDAVGPIDVDDGEVPVVVISANPERSCGLAARARTAAAGVGSRPP